MNTKATSSSSASLQELAHQALSDLTPVFLEHTAADIKQMLSLLKAAQKASSDKRFSLIRNNFFRKAHDMKGEGSTFDYPLLTFLGSVMCEYLRYKTTITLSDVNFLTDCMADVQIVFRQKITGEGNNIGEQIRQRWGTK